MPLRCARAGSSIHMLDFSTLCSPSWSSEGKPLARAPPSRSLAPSYNLHLEDILLRLDFRSRCLFCVRFRCRGVLMRWSTAGTTAKR